MKVEVQACLTKTALILLLFWMTPSPWNLPLTLFVTWCYQYVIAYMYGVHAMPTMDSLCFMGDDDTHANIISITFIENFDFEKGKEKVKKYMSDKPKLRWKIVSIWGDFYWKDTTIEESIEYVFHKIPKEVHNERDIEQVVNEDLNVEMPLGRP